MPPLACLSGVICAAPARLRGSGGGPGGGRVRAPHRRQAHEQRAVPGRHARRLAPPRGRNQAADDRPTCPHGQALPEGLLASTSLLRDEMASPVLGVWPERERAASAVHATNGGVAVHRGLSEPREAHLLHGLAGRVVRERPPAELSPQPRRAASLRTRCLSPLRRPSQSYLRTCQPATRTAGALPRMMTSGAGAFQPCMPRMPPDQVLREPRTLHCPSLCRARQRCRGCT